MKEKLKRLQKQLAEATGAEHVKINAVDMDLLLTVALASTADENALEQFDKAMTRAALLNESQRLGLTRLVRRVDTAKTYLSSINVYGLQREDLIKLETAKKALNGEFDQ